MSEQFKIVRAERTQTRLRLALQGPSGGGKTGTSLRLAKGMVEALRARGKLPGHLDGVYIGLLDTERDSAKLYSHLVPFDTLVLEPPYSPERYSAALHALERVGYPIIICDQISHEWSGKGGVLDQVSNSRETNDFAKWNGPSQAHEQFIDDLLQSPAHLIVTMRAHTAWVLEDKVGRDGKTRKSPTRIGMAPKQRSGTEYEFTTLLDLAVPTNAATCLKDRTELFTVGESVGRMDESWGVRLIDWVHSAPKVDPSSLVSPALQAQAMLEAAERLFDRATTLPDLAKAFDEHQKMLRAMSISAGREVVEPLLERLIAAKDRRKAAFGPEARVAPAGELISPDDVANLEILMADGGVDPAAVKVKFGIARLSLLPLDRFIEAQEFINAASSAPARLVAHVPARAPDPAAPSAVDHVNRLVTEIAGARDAEAGSRSFFDGMGDDIPWAGDPPGPVTAGRR